MSWCHYPWTLPRPAAIRATPYRERPAQPSPAAWVKMRHAEPAVRKMLGPPRMSVTWRGVRFQQTQAVKPSSLHLFHAAASDLKYLDYLLMHILSLRLFLFFDISCLSEHGATQWKLSTLNTLWLVLWVNSEQSKANPAIRASSSPIPQARGNAKPTIAVWHLALVAPWLQDPTLPSLTVNGSSWNHWRWSIIYVYVYIHIFTCVYILYSLYRHFTMRILRILRSQYKRWTDANL